MAQISIKQLAKIYSLNPKCYKKIWGLKISFWNPIYHFFAGEPRRCDYCKRDHS